MSTLHELGAAAAARAVAEGAISAEQLVQACLERIRAVEPQVQAWQFLDEAHALKQARARDADRAEGRPCGPLHGVPVGVKDIIDTTDMPTEDGTALHAGRLPHGDAAVVKRLRAAGAVILGKTVTTELATYAPGKTRHPSDASRSPGGSSSGSAASVAAQMVPLAIGTQSNASVIRPAAYCGVFGYKPSFGLVPRTGILKLAPSLDQVGVFARSLEDVALVAEPLIGDDADDDATRPRAALPLRRTLAEEPPLPPRFAFVKSPVWDRTAEDTREAFAELAQSLGAACEELALPEGTALAWDWHRTIMEAEMAHHLAIEWERGRDKLSASLQGQLERGRAITAFDYLGARRQAARLQGTLAEYFDHFDAIITPATTGTAPPLASTGDPAFGTLWTLLGLPSLSLPLMHGSDGLPLGVQLVGAGLADAKLLRTARWLIGHVHSAAG